MEGASPLQNISKSSANMREFLWHGQEAKDSPALVSWKQVCKPKRKGGMGFKNLLNWNIALMGKYVWWIEMKTDHLWVKWVHAIYIKQSTWKDYEPSINSSWAWRRICGIKDHLKTWMFDGNWRVTDGEYTVQKGYKWLEDPGDDVIWYPWIRNRMLLPKHRFFIWLVAQNRLLTQDRLLRMNIIQCNSCLLCGEAEEGVNHLFFLCSYSRRCLVLLEEWLQVCIPDQEVICWWLKIREKSLLKKQIIAAAIAHLMYLIWNARNRCRLEFVLPLPVHLIKQVKALLSVNLQGKRLVMSNRRIEDWLSRVGVQCM